MKIEKIESVSCNRHEVKSLITGKKAVIGVLWFYLGTATCVTMTDWQKKLQIIADTFNIDTRSAKKYGINEDRMKSLICHLLFSFCQYFLRHRFMNQLLCQQFLSFAFFFSSLENCSWTFSTFSLLFLANFPTIKLMHVTDMLLSTLLLGP